MASKILPTVFLLSCLLFLLQFQVSNGQQNVVKAGYWFSGTEFPVSSIDSSLFTHLLCAFADVNGQNYQVTISPANQARFSTFTQTVQRRNPSIKTILSIGGGDPSIKSTFASMASNPGSRKSFIDSSIRLARSNNFHGLDIDWEYPANPTEMSNFGVLLTEWRAAVNLESRNSGKSPLLLVAAVSYAANYFGVNNPVQAIANSLDWIDVMSYDFYFYNSNSVRLTGPPAALYNPGSVVSGDYGVKNWIQNGMPAKKIVLGFPFYGHSLVLENANNHGFWAPTRGLFNGGTMGYQQIRAFIAQNQAVTVFNATVVSDYCYSGTTWIAYDDIQSIATKARYAKQNGLLGYFAWQVAADDNWKLSREASRAFGA